MDTVGSGGVGMVAIGVPWWVVALVLLVLAFGAWKLVKFFWAMFGS
jgi:hypothetical protein